MKYFIKQNFQTDQIEAIDFDKLKQMADGDSLLSRIGYRKQVANSMTGKKPVVAKGEILKVEHAHSSHLEEKDKNPFYGFKCLHYSVSEASGSLKIFIENKSGKIGEVMVKTVNAEATAGEDFEAVDMTLQFKDGEKQGFVEVKIFNDDSWEPDEDFIVQLYDAKTEQELNGKDTKTKVTIIDDDLPGQISFKEDKIIKALASERQVEIMLIRKNGSDGDVTVDYETIEIDKEDHTASPGIDYVSSKGTITFKPQETVQFITIEIIDRPDIDRDESFGIQLSKITPLGAKLSKKNFMIVNIITDADEKKKEDALNQLLLQIESEEEMTWKD